MSRHRPRAPFSVSRWEQIRTAVPCLFGHDIAAGVWAYFGASWEGQRPAICEAHMQEHYQMARPRRPVVLTGEIDVRARRAGDTE